MKFWNVMVTSIFFVQAGLVACSSNSDDGGASGSGSSAVKTCADVAKCCDSLSEPQKSICNALAGPKVEQACAAGYEKVCGTADAGSAAPDPTAGACKQLRKACEACPEEQKANCLAYAQKAETMGFTGGCQNIVTSNYACQVPPQ